MTEFAVMIALLAGTFQGPAIDAGAYSSLSNCVSAMRISQRLARMQGHPNAVTLCEERAISIIPKRRPETLDPLQSH